MEISSKIFEKIVLKNSRLTFEISSKNSTNDSYHSIHLKKDSNSQYPTFEFIFKNKKIIGQYYLDNGSILSSTHICEIPQQNKSLEKSIYTLEVCGNDVSIFKDNQLVGNYYHSNISIMTTINTNYSNDIQWNNLSLTPSDHNCMITNHDPFEATTSSANSPDFVTIWSLIAVGTFLS